MKPLYAIRIDHCWLGVDANVGNRELLAACKHERVLFADRDTALVMLKSARKRWDFWECALVRVKR